MGFDLWDMVPGMSKGQFESFSARFFLETDGTQEAFRAFHAAEFGPLVELYEEALHVVRGLDVGAYVHLETEVFVDEHVKAIYREAETRVGTRLGFVLALLARDYRLGVCDLERSGWAYIYEYAMMPEGWDV